MKGFGLKLQKLFRFGIVRFGLKLQELFLLAYWNLNLFVHMSYPF